MSSICIKFLISGLTQPFKTKLSLINHRQNNVCEHDMIMISTLYYNPDMICSQNRGDQISMPLPFKTIQSIYLKYLKWSPNRNNIIYNSMSRTISEWCCILHSRPGTLTLPVEMGPITDCSGGRFSDYGLCPRLVCPVLHNAPTAGSDRRFSTYWLSGFGLISDWMVGALYLLWEIEPMHLSVEGLRPWDWSDRHTAVVLQYLPGGDPLRQSYRLCHGCCR